MPDSASLREMERSFRFLAENANDGIVVYSAEGECLYANRRARELLGYSRDEFLRVPIRDLIDPSQADLVLANFRTRMSGGAAPRVYETTLRRHDGSPVATELTAEATTWMRVPADVLIVRDISERKETEARLHREQDLNELLRREMEVRQRAEEELRRRDAISEAVSYAAQQFLRTPRWEDCIGRVFERLGLAAAVSRVNLWKAAPTADDSVHIQFQFSWGEPPPGILPDGSNDPGLFVSAVGMEPWLDLLRRGTAMRDSMES